MTLLWIALGAGLGAPARYLTDRLIQARHDSVFPWGTFAVNVVGSFVLGVLVGADSALDSALLLAVGVGFCGTLTTYSTFGYETLRLVEEGARRYAVANLVGSLLAGLAAVSLGWALGDVIS